MNNFKWMVCTQCKQTVLQNPTGVCLKCNGPFDVNDQPDSWKNLHRCKRCGRELPVASDCCGICNDDECGHFAPAFTKDLAKCAACGWVHVVVENGGRTTCFRCRQDAKNMTEASDRDVPYGATLQPVNREACCGKITSVAEERGQEPQRRPKQEGSSECEEAGDES